MNRIYLMNSGFFLLYLILMFLACIRFTKSSSSSVPIAATTTTTTTTTTATTTTITTSIHFILDARYPNTQYGSPIFWRHYKSIAESAGIVYKEMKTFCTYLLIFQNIYASINSENGFFYNHISHIIKTINDNIFNPSLSTRGQRVDMNFLITLLKIRLLCKDDNKKVIYTQTGTDEEIDKKTQQIIPNIGLISPGYFDNLPHPYSFPDSKASMICTCTLIAFIGTKFNHCLENILRYINPAKDRLIEFLKDKYQYTPTLQNAILLKAETLGYTMNKIISKIRYVVLLCHNVGLPSLGEDDIDIIIPDIMFQFINPSFLGLSDLSLYQIFSFQSQMSKGIFSKRTPWLVKTVDLWIKSNQSSCFLFSEYGFSITSIIDDLLNVFDIPVTEMIKHQFSQSGAIIGQHQCIGSSYLLDDPIVLATTEVELGIIYRLHDARQYRLTVADRIFFRESIYQLTAINLILAGMRVNVFKTESLERFIADDPAKEPLRSLPSFSIRKADQKGVHNYLFSRGDKDSKAEAMSISPFPGTSFEHFPGTSFFFVIKAIGHLTAKESYAARLHNILHQIQYIRRFGKVLENISASLSLSRLPTLENSHPSLHENTSNLPVSSGDGRLSSTDTLTLTKDPSKKKKRKKTHQQASNAQQPGEIIPEKSSQYGLDSLPLLQDNPQKKARSENS